MSWRTVSSSWFDAIIVEAAIRSGCAVLYSEELTHGRQYAGLRTCNPLLAGGT